MPPAVFISCRMKLSELLPGQCARITAVGAGAAAARLSALGVIPGAAVECRFCHPSGDPVAYLIGETVVAMRRRTADAVTVEPIQKTNGEEPQ